MRARSTGLALLAALLLNGCLLPQPDTPIIPPLKPETSRTGLPAGAPGAAAPTTRTEPVQDAQPVAMPAPEAPNTALAPADPGVTTKAQPAGQLEGTLTGATAVRVTAVPVLAGEKIVAEVGQDGTFALALMPGDYWLDIEVVGNPQPWRVGTAIAVESERTRKLAIALGLATRQATLTENVPLTTVSPSPSPTP